MSPFKNSGGSPDHENYGRDQKGLLKRAKSSDYLDNSMMGAHNTMFNE